ncbi:hypothetical protein J0X19_15190 [Hymenobacter sp. BT186]|uniref:Uncharacterized protein n=1 Tax=Hymenobacter telluris TaxID=2816474 RepID=A0A939JBM6_9BACT|nr:hypothetical protein [Hymenobacter telluris]MBO0359306.1 hypothetical protein [Hymenobacter telluris]MBW3375332.1 hypothetical protein [Hymenobacter norwichensis]
MGYRSVAVIIGFGLGTLASCISRKVDDSEIDTSDVPTERFCMYQKVGDTVRVKRVVTDKFAGSRLLSYAIWDADKRGTQQRILENQPFADMQLDSVRQMLTKQQKYWQPSEKAQELFVQIRPAPDDGGDLAVLTLRQEVEDDIDAALTAAGIGHWTAGDLGPGGGNMLFSTTNTTQAQHIIVAVLRAYHIGQKTVIARRIMNAPNDWTYEVLYPIAYSGLFNSM